MFSSHCDYKCVQTFPPSESVLVAGCNAKTVGHLISLSWLELGARLSQLLNSTLTAKE